MINSYDGVWLSLVERCVRDAKAAGSNPVIPTRIKPLELQSSKGFCLSYFCKYFQILRQKRYYLGVFGVTLGVTLFAACMVSDPKICLEILGIK